MTFRVLVIDPDAATRHHIRDRLVELSFMVDVASEPDDASYYASSRRYDVVVAPAEQPALIQQLQRDASRTIVLTGTRNPRARTTDLVLVRPVEVAVTVELLERRLGEKKPPVIQVSGLSIDTRTKEVRRGRRRIELSNREYVLLEYLAARAGQVVSVAEIAKRLYSGERTPNLIVVYVGYLRKKLGPPPIIITEHGAGYTIQE